jgi:hypothetical protein
MSRKYARRRDKGPQDRTMKARRRLDGGGAKLDVMDVLRTIAKPRLTGTRGAANITRLIRLRFRKLGYDVREDAFTFNPLPGRFALTAVGVLYTVAVFIGTVLLRTNHPYGALALLLVLGVLVGTIAAFAGRAIDRLQWGRVEGVNLFATTGEARPRFIVMAHRDSKSQPVPLAFRGPAIVLSVVIWLALLLAALLHSLKPLSSSIIVALGVVGVLAGVLLIFCWVDNRSPGALDNASGVAAAIGLAARERAAGDVAFLITDAEELGLAGARAAAGTLPPVIGVFNLDGLDDEGTFYAMERFGLLRKQGAAPHLAAALLEEAAARGEAIERRDLPFGIPVDHIPIVKGGLPAVTVMRGTLGSLRRVHLPADNLANLHGEGVQRTIELVAGALQRLRDQARALQR